MKNSTKSFSAAFTFLWLAAFFGHLNLDEFALASGISAAFFLVIAVALATFREIN